MFRFCFCLFFFVLIVVVGFCVTTLAEAAGFWVVFLVWVVFRFCLVVAGCWTAAKPLLELKILMLEDYC
jgi:hypothetical protein